jgi:two-component system, NtrC family, C4-dicarboxylate transport sensor histidine kinase DctB
MDETADQQPGRAAVRLVPAMLSMRPAGLARQIWFWIGFAAIAAAILVSTYLAADRLGHERLRQEGSHRLELYAAALESELAKYEYLPDLLTLERDIISLLRNPADPTLVRAANERLEGINRASRTAVLYILDDKGTALASSNWNEEASFIGVDLSYRPYFQEAMRRGRGRFYAIGTTSGVPGFFFARALRDGERTLGVGALKVSIDHLEQTWAGSTDVVLAADANGVIFLSSNPQWRFHTLGPLPFAVAQGITATRQYWNMQLTPLRVDVKKVLAAGARAVSVNAPEGGWQPNSDYLELRQPVPEAGWNLILLSSRQPVHELRQLAVALAALLSAFLLLLILYARQRQRSMAQSLAAKEALERANDALERKVTERTGDLLTANTQLQREISERRRAEEGLVQAGKLAALGQMAAGITHELNQPLAALRTLSANAGVFLQRGRMNDAVNNLEVIGELIDRMGKITGQLKSFARKDPVQRRPVSMKRSLANALFLLNQKIRDQRVEITEEWPGRDVQVLGDSTRLEQVIVNLVANAMDAMAGEAQQRMTIAITEVGERVRIAVRDSGPGIPEQHLPRLFEPFFTTKESGQGLGLGLVISIGIARELGGDLTAANRPEGGAEFVLDLQQAPKELLDAGQREDHSHR